MPFDLTGKKALVTGATGGFGMAIARLLHAQGACVGLSGRSEEKLRLLAESLQERAFVFPADLSEAEHISDLANQVEITLGGVDILVNNAGLTRDNLSLRMKDEEWTQIIDVNLSAPFRLARAFQRGMLKRRYGRIINIASIVGVTGNAGQANYCAAKAGMIGWSKAMAQEIAGRGVTVNCIAPGFIESPMTQILNEEQTQRILATIPIGRMGSPEDIASGVLYLASEEGAYVTGQTLHINGGMAMI